MKTDMAPGEIGYDFEQDLDERPYVQKPIAHQSVDLPAGLAWQTRYYTDMTTLTDQTITMVNTNYILVKKRVMYMINLAAPSDHIEQYDPVFDKIVQRFRWIN